jgi:repressor LexA
MKTTADLPQRQREVLDFLRRSLRERGYVPSIRELGEALGLRSTSTIHYHLTGLAERGLIRWDKGKNRAIQLIGGGPRGDSGAAVLPLAGRLVAGSPIEAIEGIDEVDLATIWPTDKVFLLEVKGQSMIDDHIAPGDWVVVRKQATAHDGDIVVALLDDGEATLKRLYRDKGGRYRLQPANPEMSPIYVPSGRLAIQGRVVGVIRRMV